MTSGCQHPNLQQKSSIAARIAAVNPGLQSAAGRGNRDSLAQGGADGGGHLGARLLWQFSASSVAHAGRLHMLENNIRQVTHADESSPLELVAALLEYTYPDELLITITTTSFSGPPHRLFLEWRCHPQPKRE